MKLKLQLPASSLLPRLLAAGLVAFGVTYACVQPVDDEEAPDPQRALVLESAATCVAETTSSFRKAADALETDVAAWKAAPDDESTLNKARSSFKEAMLLWQQAEVMQVGPAGGSGSPETGGVAGGRDLRNEIYSFPLVNACRVDQGLVDEVYLGDVSVEPVNARGLAALEYLLFSSFADTSCPPTAAIVTDGSWEATTDLSERRAAYALAVAKDIQEHATELAHAWAKDGEDFGSQLAKAGSEGIYEDQSAALNGVVDALFYIEKIVKDRKLALPLGIDDACPTETCPEDFEHPSARLSKQALVENFKAPRALLEGCGEGAIGLAQLLRDEGAGTLADDLMVALDAIDMALLDIEEVDLQAALIADPQSVTALYDAVKAFTDLLKSDLVQVLQVDLPGTVDGDND